MALSRAALWASRLRTIHPGSATKASVWVASSPGGAVLVKDVAPMHPLFRVIHGRRVLAREERALAALAGAPGVPRLVARVDRDALAMEQLDAEPLRRHLDPRRLRCALAQLSERVAGLHARGVVHLDLRQKRNILVGVGGDAYLVDFQSALVLGTDGWRGVLFRRLKRIDEGAVLKFKARYAPDLLDADELKQARRAERWLRLWVFHRFGPLLRALFGKRRSRSP